MPYEVAQHYEEYRYCQQIKPGLTHEQYLDEPADTVAWLLQIDATIAELKADAAKRRQGG